MEFPTLRGRSLAGAELIVPTDLPGATHTLVLAFRQWQQRDVDAWIAALGEVTTVYELPMLGARWQPFRPVIDGGMAANIADSGVRERTITVYGQIGLVERALRLPSREQVYLVVESHGAVRHVEPGPPQDPSAAIAAITQR